jgi:hypothetical protein
MVELSTICQLNLDNVLVRQLPGLRERAARAVAGAYAVNALAAVVVGTAFVLVVPSLVSDLAFLRDDPLAGVAFVGGLALWGVFTALRHAHWVPVENAVFGVLKLAALPVALAVAAGHGVFIAWIVPMALLLVPVNALIFGRAVRRHRGSAPAADAGPAALGRRGLGIFFAQDYAGQVLMRLAVTVIPGLVVATLGAAANAYFFVAFTIVIACDMMVLGIGTSLLAESAYDARLRRAHVDRRPPVRPAAARRRRPARGRRAARAGAVRCRLCPRGRRRPASPRPGQPPACRHLPRVHGLAPGGPRPAAPRDRGTHAGVAARLVVPLANAFELTGVALAWLGSASVAGLVAGTWLTRHLRHGGP